MKKGSGDPVTRRVDGFIWLARHPRRSDIVAYVTGNRDAAPDWLKADRVWPKVNRDRAVWKAAAATTGNASIQVFGEPGSVTPVVLTNDAGHTTVWNRPHTITFRVGNSLRAVSEAVAKSGIKVSHQMVDNILTVYGAGGPKPPDDQPRLKLRLYARKAITREVIARFDAGELSAAQVAKLIGHGADYRNAVYWIQTMREHFRTEDGPPQSSP